MASGLSSILSVDVARMGRSIVSLLPSKMPRSSLWEFFDTSVWLEDGPLPDRHASPAVISALFGIPLNDRDSATITPNADEKTPYLHERRKGLYCAGVIGFEPTTLRSQTSGTTPPNPTKNKGIPDQPNSVTQTVTLVSDLPSKPAPPIDPQLSRLIALFATANATQRGAILTVAETIVVAAKSRES